jgi:hypothetical protein
MGGTINGVSGRLLGSARSLVAWSVLLSPALAWGQEATLVQQIGDLSSEVAEAVAAEVTVVPFSPAIDARTTPIIVAPGEMFLTRDGSQVRGLSGPERRALRQAYGAGQTIVLLHGSVHDIEALHLLLEDGVTHTSDTDPAVLAYALRQESGIPTVRIVHEPRPGPLPAPRGLPAFEDEGALERALDVIVSELVHPPVLAAPPTSSAAAGPADWSQFPVQTGIITSTSNGNYNTPVDIYALHACQGNNGNGFDHYLVDTGGDWTATEAAFLSASIDEEQPGIFLNPDGSINVRWVAGQTWCNAGLPVFNGDERICTYTPYPLWYKVDILPPSGPTVVQVNAAPAGDQGQSVDYTSGFSFSIGGDVAIQGGEGGGPSAGIEAGATWDNEVTTTVPALIIEAGDNGPGNQGTFTTYQYCTVGDAASNCSSNIQMTNPSGAGCLNYIVGQPQQGQTPDGRLSNVVQSVRWQVDPLTYGGATTFDVTVTWQVALATSTAFLWYDTFFDPITGQAGGDQYKGYCNAFGCSCSMPWVSWIDTHSLTFKVPIPSSSSCKSG